MTALQILLARLLGLFGGGARRERELRAEIDAHLAEAVDEYVRQGMTPEEARHSALRKFGGVTQTVEAIALSAASRSSRHCVRMFITPYGR